MTAPNFVSTMAAADFGSVAAMARFGTMAVGSSAAVARMIVVAEVVIVAVAAAVVPLSLKFASGCLRHRSVVQIDRILKTAPVVVVETVLGAEVAGIVAVAMVAIVETAAVVAMAVAEVGTAEKRDRARTGTVFVAMSVGSTMAAVDEN